MRDFFRLKLVSKRQVTIPQLMLEKLHMQEGDELEFEIEDGSIVAVRPMKLVPTDFFSESMLRKLEERSRSMDAGQQAHEPLAQVPGSAVRQPRSSSPRAKGLTDLDSTVRTHSQPSRNETESASGD
jgi:AbrB family looped-hinge helix DNA binding protein